MTPDIKIGQAVRYHIGGAVNDGADGRDPFYVAAIVTMTRTEWCPGTRSPDGTWTPTNGVQPETGTVHVHVFWPATTDSAEARAAWSTEFQHVSYGLKHGCWSEISAL